MTGVAIRAESTEPGAKIRAPLGTLGKPDSAIGRIIYPNDFAGLDGPSKLLDTLTDETAASSAMQFLQEGQMVNSKPAVVLLSGGLDSTTALAIAVSQGFQPYALTFRYGQRHEAEIEAARRVAERAGVAQHVVAQIDLRMFGGSALTSNIDVPKDRPIDEMSEGIPVTYVPARNTIFLSFALAWAEVIGASDVFIGVNALDYSGYPDCRPEYIEAYEKMANLATKAGVEGRQVLKIHTPLIHLTKAQIIQRGLSLGVDYGLTVTCYDPSDAGDACGRCDACQLRLKGFAENGLGDPAPYRPATVL